MKKRKRSLRKSYKNQQGFSLLALLVAIVVLGAMVAWIFASLDPIEQFNKMRDEEVETNAANFMSAEVQYFSKHTALPWFSTENKGAGCYAAGTTLPSVPLKDMVDCLSLLVNDGLLQEDFLLPSNLNKLIVTNPNPQTGKDLDTIICFIPQSKTHQSNENTHYNIDGSDAKEGTCKSQGGTQACYWCTQ